MTARHSLLLRNATRAGAAWILAIVCLLSTGCLITSNERTDIQGTRVSKETLDQIEPGATEEFVLALLGEPTSRKSMNDGTTLLRWTYSKTTRKDGAVLVLFSGSKETTESGAIYAVLDADKVVQRVWRD